MKENMESAFNEKQWILIAHLSGFAGFAFPFGNIVGPLLVWLLKKENSLLLEEHAREALNFQISVTIYVLISSLLLFVFIGIVIIPIILIIQVVLMIKAALLADKGGFYVYPFTIRFIRVDK